MEDVLLIFFEQIVSFCAILLKYKLTQVVFMKTKGSIRQISQIG